MIVPVDTRLRRHLRRWLGRWPAAETFTVVGSRQRMRPGWDGRVFPVIGVRSPESTVLSVPPARAPVVRDVARRGDWSELLAALPALVDHPHQRVYSGVFRFCLEPVALADAGVWVDASKPSVPEWLRPFGHEVLIAWDVDTGAYLAGVGIKHHDRYGHELAVGTEPAARGQGLARRLVAQAARRVIDEGGVPTYQHDPANIASAKVAEAAGFPDRGWRSVGLG
jgi:GNAT superfamily N-acetyltransferase